MLQNDTINSKATVTKLALGDRPSTKSSNRLVHNKCTSLGRAIALAIFWSPPFFVFILISLLFLMIAHFQITLFIYVEQYSSKMLHGRNWRLIFHQFITKYTFNKLTCLFIEWEPMFFLSRQKVNLQQQSIVTLERQKHCRLFNNKLKKQKHTILKKLTRHTYPTIKNKAITIQQLKINMQVRQQHSKNSFELNYY